MYSISSISDLELKNLTVLIFSTKAKKRFQGRLYAHTDACTTTRKFRRQKSIGWHARERGRRRFCEALFGTSFFWWGWVSYRLPAIGSFTGSINSLWQLFISPFNILQATKSNFGRFYNMKHIFVPFFPLHQRHVKLQILKVKTVYLEIALFFVWMTFVDNSVN